MEHGLKDFAFSVQKHITHRTICYIFLLVYDKPLGASPFVKLIYLTCPRPLGNGMCWALTHPIWPVRYNHLWIFCWQAWPTLLEKKDLPKAKILSQYVGNYLILNHICWTLAVSRGSYVSNMFPSVLLSSEPVMLARKTATIYLYKCWNWCRCIQKWDFHRLFWQQVGLMI